MEEPIISTKFYLGVLAYYVWATHGLPLEVTIDIYKEHGLEIDRRGYWLAKECHKRKSNGTKKLPDMR